MISARSASLRYLDHGREVFACREVELTVFPGEFLGILGPSGSGKSSLLYMLSGLKTPTSGDVTLDGEPIGSMNDDLRSTIRLRKFGFVFQYPYLLGYLSALENVLVARPDEDRITEAKELLGKLGIADKQHRLPYELSGGEKQRVCVARALLGSPEVIFADEPTAALDHRNGLQVVELLEQHRKQGALIMVTHDPSMLDGADRIVRIEDGVLVTDTPS